MDEPLLLDREAILESLGGDEELFVDLASMFVEESQAYSQNLACAVTENNAESLRNETHTLKSLFATFADEGGRQMAISIEQQAKNGEINREKTQELVTRIFRLAALLQQEIA